MTATTGTRSVLAFEHLVQAVILANSIVMIGALVDHHHAEFLETVDDLFLAFFAAELLVRLSRARWAFFRSPWLMADGAIIVLALLPVLGGGMAVLRVARLARSAHLLRHIAHARLWRVALPRLRRFPSD
jgi:hypothetical protein